MAGRGKKFLDALQRLKQSEQKAVESPEQKTPPTTSPTTIGKGRGMSKRVVVAVRTEWTRDTTGRVVYSTTDFNKLIMIKTEKDSQKVDEFITNLNEITQQMGFTSGDQIASKASN